MIPNLSPANPHMHRQCPSGRRNRAVMTSHAPMLDFAGSILYLAALLGDRPRSIDHYIDYFGDGTERAGRSEPALSTPLAI